MTTMMGKAAISVCTSDKLSLTVDAIVEEQDTNLILGTHPVIRDTEESYPALVRKMERQKPLLPGQIIIRNTIPLRITAILYDIEQTPVCTEELIADVLNDLLDKFDEYKLKLVAIPLLGCTHGKIKASGFIKLLQDTLITRNLVYPAEIMLIVPPDSLDDISDIIEYVINTSKPA
jgi:hypothetical protein